MSLTISPDCTAAIVEYVWCCRACHAEHRTRHTIPRRVELLLPSIPTGWCQVNGEFYCPVHKVLRMVSGIVYCVDGKAVE